MLINVLEILENDEGSRQVGVGYVYSGVWGDGNGTYRHIIYKEIPM